MQTREQLSQSQRDQLFQIGFTPSQINQFSPQEASRTIRTYFNKPKHHRRAIRNVLNRRGPLTK